MTNSGRICELLNIPWHEVDQFGNCSCGDTNLSYHERQNHESLNPDYEYDQVELLKVMMGREDFEQFLTSIMDDGYNIGYFVRTYLTPPGLLAKTLVEYLEGKAH